MAQVLRRHKMNFWLLASDDPTFTLIGIWVMKMQMGDQCQFLSFFFSVFLFFPSLSFFLYVVSLSLAFFPFSSLTLPFKENKYINKTFLKNLCYTKII